MPKISVIVPVYNVEKYLYRCIDSILAQTFLDFELILVDDGSLDNCGIICDRYAENDNRIHVIHKENGGRSDARNSGIEWVLDYSDSDWIAFVDSDDWIHPQYLELLVNAALETKCEVVVCDYKETIGDTPKVDTSFVKAEIINTEYFYCTHNIQAVVPWGKMQKKELFRYIRYPVGKEVEDEFTTYKVLFQHQYCTYLNIPLYYYYKNMESFTKSQWNEKKLDSIEALDEVELFMRNNNHIMALRFCAIRIVKNIASHYIMLSQTEDKENADKYLSKIRKKYIKAIRYAKKNADFKVKENTYFYELAFPRKMKYYWYLQALKKKTNKIMQIIVKRL